MQPNALEAQQTMVAALLAHARRDDATAELVETHISWVLLHGTQAHKIKKALSLGFLDFSALARRRYFCEEELRLNRQLAPQIYLEVAAISGSAAAPNWVGEGGVIDYAVRMRRFGQTALLDQLLAAGRLTPAHIDALAAAVARFHAGSCRAAAGAAYGSPQAIEAPVRENFAVLRARLSNATMRALCERAAGWSQAEHLRLAAVFAARRAAGFVRECHGDLHLGNVVLIDGQPTPFDRIEFDPNLRWIDVASDIAFAVMDLAARGRDDYAARLLSHYLEATGDYGALAVLPYYQIYRAVVRAKVAAIRADQPGLDAAAHAAINADCLAHLELALRLATAQRPALIITHGLSGSGKSTLAGHLVEGLGALRLRSDVERKRLHGLAAGAATASPPGAGIYAADETRRTYEALLHLARQVLESGRVAIVDATFLDVGQRLPFRQLAEQLALPFVILDCRADEALLRARIRARSGDASEATLEVLDRQLAGYQPIMGDELAATLAVDTAACVPGEVLKRLRARITH